MRYRRALAIVRSQFQFDTWDPSGDGWGSRDLKCIRGELCSVCEVLWKSRILWEELWRGISSEGRESYWVCDIELKDRHWTKEPCLISINSIGMLFSHIYQLYASFLVLFAGESTEICHQHSQQVGIQPHHKGHGISKSVKNSRQVISIAKGRKLRRLEYTIYCSRRNKMITPARVYGFLCRPDAIIH